MEKIAESLNNLEENFNWGQNLFEKRFEVVGTKKYSHVGDNITEVTYHSVSMEQLK